MPPPQRMHNLNATIIWKIVIDSRNDYEIWKKAFHQFIELVKTNPLIYNALKFNQY